MKFFMGTYLRFSVVRFDSLRDWFRASIYSFAGIWKSFLALLILGVLRFCESPILWVFLDPILDDSPDLAAVWKWMTFLVFFASGF
jgi:hypothetical protein